MQNPSSRVSGAPRHNPQLKESIMKYLYAALCAMTLAACGPFHKEWSCDLIIPQKGWSVTAETEDVARTRCRTLYASLLASKTGGVGWCTKDSDCDTAQGYTCNQAPALMRADGSIPAVCTASCTGNPSVCDQYGNVPVNQAGGCRCMMTQSGGTCNSDCGANCATKCGTGHACTSGVDCQSNICTGGVCEGSGGGGCTGGTTLCGNACVNLQGDSANCGACGRVCGSGQICSNGTCTTQNTGPCGAGQIKLNDNTCVPVNMACKDGGGSALPIILSCCNGRKDGNETCTDGGGSDCNQYYRCRAANDQCRVQEDCNWNSTLQYPGGLFCAANNTCQPR